MKAKYIQILALLFALLVSGCINAPEPSSFGAPDISATASVVSDNEVVITGNVANSSSGVASVTFTIASDQAMSTVVKTSSLSGSDCTTSGVSRSYKFIVQGLGASETYYYTVSATNGRTKITSSVQSFTMQDVFKISADGDRKVGYAGGTVELEITSSLGLKVKNIDVDWISEVQTRSAVKYNKQFFVVLTPAGERPSRTSTIRA